MLLNDLLKHLTTKLDLSRTVSVVRISIIIIVNIIIWFCLLY